MRPFRGCRPRRRCRRAAKDRPLHKTARYKLHSPAHDASDQDIHVTAPVAASQGAAPQQFPLVAYAHGFLGGGELDIHGYDELFHQISSFGFVVAAHASCNSGCKRPGGASPWTRCAGLPELSPPFGWGSYYSETLKTIEFARNYSRAPPFSLVNFSLGVGVAGHSMGGQSTAVAAGAACTRQWDIRAAVIHHPASGVNGATGRNVGANITVPTASFTSSGDTVCAAELARDIYAAMPPTTPRLFRNQVRRRAALARAPG